MVSDASNYYTTYMYSRPAGAFGFVPYTHPEILYKDVPLASFSVGHATFLRHGSPTRVYFGPPKCVR